MRKLTPFASFTLIVVLIGVACLFSCKKDAAPQGSKGPVGEAGSSATGFISGKITRYSETASRYKTQPANEVTISISGKTQTTMANASGEFTLSNISPGVHTLEFNASNGAWTQLQQVVHTGNDTKFVKVAMQDASQDSLYGRIFDTIIGSLSKQISFWTYRKFRSDVDYEGYQLALVGTQATINPKDASTFVFSRIFSDLASSTNRILLTELSTKVSSGTKIYVRLYPINKYFPQETSWFTDVVSLQTIYTTAGRPLPQVFSITMP